MATAGRILAAFDRRDHVRFRTQFLRSLRASGNSETVWAFAYGLYPTELARLVRDALDGCGIATLTDHRFPARGATTLVQWGRGRGIPAVQLEVSVRLVPPFADEGAVVRLVDGLTAAVAACRP